MRRLYVKNSLKLQKGSMKANTSRIRKTRNMKANNYNKITEKDVHICKKKVINSHLH